jgi:hypothetical protein
MNELQPPRRTTYSIPLSPSEAVRFLGILEDAEDSKLNGRVGDSIEGSRESVTVTYQATETQNEALMNALNGIRENI